MTLHFLNHVAYDAESTKNRKYVIIASLKSETMGKHLGQELQCLLIVKEDLSKVLIFQDAKNNVKTD